MRKGIITGGSGKLGAELKKVFPNALFPTREEMDLTSYESISNYFKKHKPSFLVHAGAMTGIPRCEKNRAVAWMTNVEGTRHLRCCALPNMPFIYVSTACVFRGDEHGSHDENHPPYPKNFYGFTKSRGEEWASRHDNFCIVRTNFVAKEEWPHPKAFIDRKGTYLWASDVARILKRIVDKMVKGKMVPQVVHACGEDVLSMHELALRCSKNAVGMITRAESECGELLTKNMCLSTIHDEYKGFKIGKVK